MHVMLIHMKLQFVDLRKIARWFLLSALQNISNYGVMTNYLGFILVIMFQGRAKCLSKICKPSRSNIEANQQRFPSYKFQCRAQIDSLFQNVVPLIPLSSSHFVVGFQIWKFQIFWRNKWTRFSEFTKIIWTVKC